MATALSAIRRKVFWSQTEWNAFGAPSRDTRQLIVLLYMRLAGTSGLTARLLDGLTRTLRYLDKAVKLAVDMFGQQHPELDGRALALLSSPIPALSAPGSHRIA